MFRRMLIASAAVAALGGTALAADLPTTKGPPVYTPPPPIFTWTGVYIGGQVGYEFGRAYPIVGGVAAAPFSPNGVVGGGHVGYNYQIGMFVLGVEGDANGASYNGGNGVAFSRTPLDGSVRGRLGYAWDRALLYATGGVAFADFHDTDIFGDSVWTGRVGWTAGGGIDYAIDNNWSLSLEYRYTDYGRYYFTGPVTGTAVSVRQYDNRVQAGFSYKFDWLAAPVVSKY
jgi:outer membrane immunogenic protein